jgi:membrane associated rhomboid family serine protease
MAANKDLKIIIRSFLPGLILVLLLFSVKGYEWLAQISLSDHGVFPRKTSGLWGILFMPLLHSDWEHLLSNAIPLLILLAGMRYFYPTLALKVFLWVYLLSGFWLWPNCFPFF